jgi:hypothetical protein
MFDIIILIARAYLMFVGKKIARISKIHKRNFKMQSNT